MAGKATPRKGPPSPADEAGGVPENAQGGTLTMPLPKVPQLELPVPDAPAIQALRVRPPSIPPAAIEARKPYWVGTMSGAPFHNWTSPKSGARFVRYTGKQDDKGQPESKVPGQVVVLSDSQRDATLEQIAQHVVRHAPGGSAHIWPVDYHAYRQDQADEPLGKFLFMYPLDPVAPHNRPTLKPEPLFRED